MQLSAFLFTQLPQYLLNLTNPSPTPLSASITNPSSSILPGDMAVAEFTLPALPYAYDVSFIPHLILIWGLSRGWGVSQMALRGSACFRDLSGAGLSDRIQLYGWRI